jgi:circadian clock protein KaiC
MSPKSPPASNFLSTGIPGLDNILGGGLLKDRIYLIEGEPGTGKTTTGLQFLVEGVRGASRSSTSRWPRRPRGT